MRSLDSTTHRANRRGFTLFEVLTASAILALAVVALTQAVVAGQMQSHAALQNARAVALCQTMIEEILAHENPRIDPDSANIGPDNGESRVDYDTVEDYNGFAEDPGTAKHDAQGNPYPDVYDRFKRSVTITGGSGNSDGHMTIPGPEAQVQGLTITVIVQDGPNGRTWTLHRFVPFDQSNDEIAS